MRRPIFSQSKLDELSSPEQLDTMMRVTTPKGWLALVALIALIALALVWSAVSELPVGVTGSGILLHGDGLDRIVAPAAGQLQALTVSVGDTVSPGDVIGLVQPAGPTDSPVELTSPFAGRVVENAVFPGDLVDRGQAILTLIPMEDDLSVVMYVQASAGQAVQPGMEVDIAPASVSSAEYGVMKGVVASVGAFPTSSARITRLLGNDLAGQRFESAGPLVEVRVAPEVDATTVSGYRWSSPNGPPASLQSGTFVQATVVVDRARPIDLLLARMGL